MNTYNLQSITPQLLDCTVQSSNGTIYLVQIYDTRTKAGINAVIQRIGAPEIRPLNEYVLNRSVALARINAVLKRIQCEVRMPVTAREE